ncbi:hypothetical protein MKZ38_003030 [Zalerion maritima]|uniref:Uncharacterized protein n=1 Tax=Zalerion maritima TaxID=339359 RepID=A0AAD5RP82_9PEZI|nr:hypothetical protein MKZ38_003030 [Zalerion maritima]
MEDQFGGRTDDDLFADDFEPVPEARNVSVPVSTAPSHHVQAAPPVANTTTTPPQAHITQPGGQEQAKTATSPQHETSDARIPPSTGANLTSVPGNPHRNDASTSPSRPAATDPPPSKPVHRSMMNSRFAPKGQTPGLHTDTLPPNEAAQSHNQGRGPRQRGKKGSREANAHHPASATAPFPVATPAQDGVEDLNQGQASASAAKPGSTKSPVQRLDPVARLASGGAPRTKLTDEELTAKMERMHLRNQDIARRHEAAEMDKKAHREALVKGQEEARKKRAEETERRKRGEEDHKKLENEREKNRARKLKAIGMKQGGWDEGKEDLMEQMEGGSRRAFRGAHGGVRGVRGQGLAGSRFAPVAPAVIPGEGTPEEGAADREFVPRGRGRGRARGRGGRDKGGFDRNGARDHTNGHHHENGDTEAARIGKNQQRQKSAQEKPKLDATEFPALPTAPKPEDKPRPVIPKFGDLDPFSQLSPIGKWDEEVEEEARK